MQRINRPARTPRKAVQAGHCTAEISKELNSYAKASKYSTNSRPWARSRGRRDPCWLPSVGGPIQLPKTITQTTNRLWSPSWENNLKTTPKAATPVGKLHIRHKCPFFAIPKRREMNYPAEYIPRLLQIEPCPCQLTTSLQREENSQTLDRFIVTYVFESE